MEGAISVPDNACPPAQGVQKCVWADRYGIYPALQDGLVQLSMLKVKFFKSDHY